MPVNSVTLPGKLLIDYTRLDEIVVQKLSDLTFIKAGSIDRVPNQDTLARFQHLITSLPTAEKLQLLAFP
jgi:hypothetical protein